MNYAALVAAEAALGDRGFLRRYVREVLESREQLARGLERLGARVFPSGANFVLVDFGPGGSHAWCAAWRAAASCCATARQSSGATALCASPPARWRRRAACCAPIEEER